jgi:hypothetical protein
MVTYSFVSSTIAMIIFNKAFNFGPGFLPKFIKFGISLAMLAFPTYYTANAMKAKLD